MTGVEAGRRRMSQAGRRRVLVLSAATVLSAVLAVISYTPLQFASMSPTQAIFLVVAAVVAATGVWSGVRILVPIVGVAMIAFGLIRLASYGQSWSFFNGGSSTGALMVGLGIAYVAIALSESWTDHESESQSLRS